MKDNVIFVEFSPKKRKKYDKDKDKNTEKNVFKRFLNHIKQNFLKKPNVKNIDNIRDIH